MRFIFAVLFLLLLLNSSSFSQTDGGEQQAPQPAPAPQSQTQPSDFPDYIVTPKENLDPFGQSSIGDSTTGDDYREGAGTLGTTRERPSNTELNKRLQEKRKKESESRAEQEEPDIEIDYETAYPTGAGPDMKSSTPRTTIYRWTDDKGVTHITNDIGSIPSKYMDQITDQLKKD